MDVTDRLIYISEYAKRKEEKEREKEQAIKQIKQEALIRLEQLKILAMNKKEGLDVWLYL